MEQLMQEDPEVYQKLVDDALVIRGAVSVDYADLLPEVAAWLLGDFPKTLMNELEEHGCALPIHIWCIAAFATSPNQEVKAYIMMTSSVGAIHRTLSHKVMRQEFMKWLTDNLGRIGMQAST
ncbi:hypothetical protein FRC11_004736 [Ceratobasidium sp. 423]|nr:hypothetical protein FRC11_004736 [Ceratobasidium sp. 423]